MLNKPCLALCVVAFLCASFQVSAESPYLTVLGIGQDAGYPQAGCFKAHCLPGWKGKRQRHYATSLGLILPSSKQKYIFEATPDFPQQYYLLQQHAPTPQYEFAGIFLTHAHIGHYAGLMFLGREAMGSDNVPVFVMPKMLDFIQTNGPWSQLVKLQNITLQPLAHNKATQLSGVKVVPFLVPHRDEYSETVGYKIIGPNKTAVFIPDINKWEDWQTSLSDLVLRSDYLLLDATFYAIGELPGRDMSKIPHPFVTESMALLADLPVNEKNKVFFIHMNHTNPLLMPMSKEALFVKKQHFNVAFQGMTLSL